jgi:hypothetical protein
VTQVGGTHYEDLGLQPFDAIDAWGLGFYLGSALKYIARAGKKPGADEIEDLKKARHYLDEHIQRLEAKAARPGIGCWPPVAP